MTTLDSIEGYYPASFRPLSTILDGTRWNTQQIGIYRCSVFPDFITSVEDLITCVDNITIPDRDSYRNKFANLLTTTSSYTSVYKSTRFSKTIGLLTSVSVDDVVGLTESCSRDFFLPELATVFLAHDDFGFNILFDKEKNLSGGIISNIRTCGLYLLIPPE